MVVQRGMDDTGVIDEKVAISPLRDGKGPTPGVFKRAPSGTFSRVPSLVRTGSFASVGSFKRTVSSLGSAVGLAKNAPSHKIRVAEEFATDDGSPPSASVSRKSDSSKGRAQGSVLLQGSAPAESEPADPLTRFKKTSSLDETDLDPGERKVLLSRGMGSSGIGLAVSADACGDPVPPGQAAKTTKSRSRKWLLSKKSFRDSRAQGNDEQSSMPDNVGDQDEGTSNAGDKAEARTHDVQAGQETDKFAAVQGGKARGHWKFLRKGIVGEDEAGASRGTEQGNSAEDENELETEEQKKLKKILAKFKKARSAEVAEAERKAEAGEELTTKEKLALFMAEKKLKKAFSRAESAASKKSLGEASAAPSGNFSRVQSGFSRTASIASDAFARLGSLQRTLSGAGGADADVGRSPRVSETFQRAHGEVAGTRLHRKTTALETVLPMLAPPRTPGQNASVPLPASSLGSGGAVAAPKAGSMTTVSRGSSGKDLLSQSTVPEDANSNTTLKPRRPDSGRPSRLAQAGPGARVKK